MTDPTMTRFWMTIEEAVDLVLLAAREMRGGEVFIPKVKGSRIDQLLMAIGQGLAGMYISGIRRGEKLHEILISEHEARHTYDHGDHYRIEPDATWEDKPRADVGEPAPTEFWTKRGMIPWSLRSDTCEQLTEAELREMIGMTNDVKTKRCHGCQGKGATPLDGMSPDGFPNTCTVCGGSGRLKA